MATREVTRPDPVDDFHHPFHEAVWLNCPRDQLKATFFGMGISLLAPKLEKAEVRSFGRMIYDKRDGLVHLEVDGIKAVPRGLIAAVSARSGGRIVIGGRHSLIRFQDDGSTPLPRHETSPSRERLGINLIVHDRFLIPQAPV